MLAWRVTVSNEAATTRTTKTAGIWKPPSMLNVNLGGRFCSDDIITATASIEKKEGYSDAQATRVDPLP